MTSLARVPFESNPLHSMLLDEPVAASEAIEQVSSRVLTIRAADSEGHRSSARVLVNRMYAGRGYDSASIAEARLERGITLVGTDHDVARGTITIAFDDPHLLADECFADVLADLRRQGVVLCEFIKLAIDGVGRSRRVLASLFHTAFIYAREIKGCDRVVVEVNPRHIRFYQRMLGFSSLAGERPNPRVNAPAVLLSLDLSFAERQILLVQSAARHKSRIDRSLYRDCFSHDEVAVIVGRLRDRTNA